MKQISINIDNALSLLNINEITTIETQLKQYKKNIYNKIGKGSDFLGWSTLPNDVTKLLLNSIITDSKLLRSKAKIIVVVGIGGSYLGARAVIEALGHHFQSFIDLPNPKILYAGNNISDSYFHDLLEILNVNDYALVVISKSGTTTEPAIAFRILKQHLEQKYGIDESRKRIIAITDKTKGALKQIADNESYKSYVIPDDVGGRYSVLTPVGLLPISIAGFDIEKIIEGARTMKAIIDTENSIQTNPAFAYAAARNTFYKSGKKIEILASYNPELAYINEWWKQLFGESEGKENKGIFPASVIFTTDLHSLGQYIQEGERILFETTINIENSNKIVKVPYEECNLDELNYLAGKSLSEINYQAQNGTIMAHKEGGAPNLTINIPEINEFFIGQLIYFFEYSCALSCYLLDVNPFDQPGVEAYKKNMFKLLKKPGY